MAGSQAHEAQLMVGPTRTSARPRSAARAHVRHPALMRHSSWPGPKLTRHSSWWGRPEQAR
eukprot:2535522-Heterocapsa_arctica.AAC.1